MLSITSIMRPSTLALALISIPLAFSATIEVAVGPNGNLVYQPESVTAQAGDIINFTLYVT